MATPGDPNGSTQSIYRAVERGLGEVVPGLEILDRDLELAEDLTVQLVGRDARGHLVLVLVVEGDADGLTVVALEALRQARAQRSLLSRHLGDPRLRGDLPERVYLISDSFDDLVVGRLTPLLGDAIELFEVRTVRSARGENAYLVRIHSSAEGPAAAESESTSVFLAALPEEVRDVARIVVRRLSRVDDELDRSSTRQQVLWRSGEAVLARLGWEDGLLRGSVPSRGSAFPLRSERDVDPFVEEVVSSYVENLRASPHTDLQPPLEEGRPPLAALAVEQAVLTSDELDAFRD